MTLFQSYCCRRSDREHLHATTEIQTVATKLEAGELASCTSGQYGRILRSSQAMSGAIAQSRS